MPGLRATAQLLDNPDAVTTLHGDTPHRFTIRVRENTVTED